VGVKFGALDVLINNAAGMGRMGEVVTDGAASVVWAALLPDVGPSGGLYRDGRDLPW
jgi:hypothetical protein